jgi:transposase-like protein
MTTNPHGVSALQVQRQLRIDRYESAWVILHKLRQAMQQAGREPLKGKVEVDKTHIDGFKDGFRRTHDLAERPLVVAAVEVRGSAAGRVRLQVIPEASESRLTGLVKASVERGAIVITDGPEGYRDLARMGYRHRPRLRAGSDGMGVRQVDRVFSHLGAWLRGTHRRIGAQHLQVYLDEFAFRLNRRWTPIGAFHALLGLATSDCPPP